MEATKKIKLVVDGKTRKINVERRNVLKSIASIVGKPSSFTYVDSDDDEITCLTEEELSCAIFEDNITKFAAEFTGEESSESSGDIRQPRALHELTNPECEDTTPPPPPRGTKRSCKIGIVALTSQAAMFQIMKEQQQSLQIHQLKMQRQFLKVNQLLSQANLENLTQVLINFFLN